MSTNEISEKKAASEKKTATILLHAVEFCYRGEFDPDELPESEVEHIEEMIKEGYNQGELCYYDAENDVEHRGWWNIL